MAKALSIQVKESMEELQKYYRNASCVTIKKRIKMLMVIHKRAPEMLPKNELSKLCKCDPNSIISWRRMYLKGGIETLIQHNWQGTSSKHISKAQNKELENKLNDSNNGLVGYKELLHWVENNFDISIKYTTLYEYVKRNFKTKIKVARKSHIKKSEEEIATFKKNG
jgi:transposase